MLAAAGGFDSTMYRTIINYNFNHYSNFTRAFKAGIEILSPEVILVGIVSITTQILFTRPGLVKLVPVLWTVETIGSLIDMQVFIRLLHLMADNTLNLLKLSLSKENFDLEVRGFHIRLLKL